MKQEFACIAIALAAAFAPAVICKVALDAGLAPVATTPSSLDGSAR